MADQATQKETYTIDASGKTLGRVATDAARALMGKDAPDFERQRITGSRIEVINTAQLSIGEKKRRQKVYVRYTGYPGGQRRDTLQDVLDKKGYAEVCRRAIYGMLPANRLRAHLMKRVQITE